MRQSLRNKIAVFLYDNNFKSLATIIQPKIKDTPEGYYCHFSTKVCPFWDTNPLKHRQSSVFCKLTGVYDWKDTEGHSLLWDQVKEGCIKPGDPKGPFEVDDDGNEVPPVKIDFSGDVPTISKEN